MTYEPINYMGREYTPDEWESISETLANCEKSNCEPTSANISKLINRYAALLDWFFIEPTDPQADFKLSISLAKHFIPKFVDVNQDWCPEDIDQIPTGRRPLSLPTNLDQLIRNSDAKNQLKAIQQLMKDKVLDLPWDTTPETVLRVHQQRKKTYRDKKAERFKEAQKLFQPFSEETLG